MDKADLDRSCPARLRDWLVRAVESEASDLHVVSGYPPMLRVHGELRELEPGTLDDTSVRALLLPACPAQSARSFEAHSNVDFALELSLGDQRQRFRANYFLARQQMGGCFRIIASTIPDFRWAGFPEALAQQLSHYRNGLVLICGVVGSGKTTSLAMIINLLNKEGGHRIITVEEPVEYLFPRMPGSVVTQREVGEDVHTFADGLKYALRQDPDVIYVGEIRDRETAQMALSAAETGHLVFSTLHTRDAKGAISRYADFFPQSDQRDVRCQLSFSLRSVISQHLLPNVNAGEKRVLAMEVLFNTHAVASAIRSGKMESMDNVIVTSRAEGMQSLDQSLKALLKAHRISRETAERYVTRETKL